jgi:membrane protein DedA with SNARE-associated domain
MNASHLTDLILQYRYFILIPLTFLEGPLVAFVAGTLAAAGYFNVYFLAILFFVRDVGLDGVYYALGYYGGRTAFAQKMLRKLKITDGHLTDVKILWEKYPGRTMFLGKLSYGIASAFIVVAGTVRMRLTEFFFWGSIVAVSQYGTLLVLGYFFGQTLGGRIETILSNFEYVIAVIFIFITGYYIFSHLMKSRFMEKKEEQKTETEVVQKQNPSSKDEG